jgi:hypothetical protein
MSMNITTARPEIGQWYSRADKGEEFQVVGYDDRSRMIEVQAFDGDLDEMDEDTWNSLPLERAEPPEDLTGALDDIETDDLGYSATEMKPTDWTQPLEPLKIAGEAWEDSEPEEERDALGEGVPVEPFSADLPEARERMR